VTIGERRRATRYNFGAVAEVTDLASQRYLVALTRDLSLSGCFIKTTTPLTEGTRVNVRITSSGAEFSATGKVSRNVTTEGMGIEFIEITPGEQAILQKWLADFQ
jgi:hypothetical protein